MKVFYFLPSLVLLLTLILPFPIFAQDDELVEEVDVYEVFWPIVPGKTINDSMYWVKQLKESAGEIFTFGDINKAKYQATLSEKRLVEANKLFEDKDYGNAIKTLEMSEDNRKNAIAYQKKAVEAKRDVNELRINLVSSFEKQEKVLKYLLTKLPEDQKQKVEEMLKNLTLQISEAR